MQFLLVLAVVAAVSISEYVPHQPVANVGWRFGWAVLGMAIAPLFAVATSSFVAVTLRHDASRKTELLWWFNRLRGMHSLVWLIVSAVVLQAFGWVQLVRYNWNLENVFLADDLLILTPIVLPLVLSWAAFYEVERSLHLAAGGSAESSSLVTRSQYLGLHVRHYLGLMLVPVLAVLAVQDVVRMLAPYIPGEAEAWLLLVPFFALVAFFPVVLKCLWKTQPLPDSEFRDRLLAFGRRVNFRPGDLLVWKTDRMIVNAAVAGFIRPLRYVFFTDTLLAKFSHDEVEAVLGHEIGHVARRHLIERVMLMALPVVVWCVFTEAYPSSVEAASQWLEGIGLTTAMQTALCGPICLALFAGTVFALHARLLEHEADLFACRACDDDLQLTPTSIARMTSVLEKLAHVSGVGRKTRTWLHPTIAGRVTFLHGIALDPARGARFERMQRTISRLLGLTLIAGIAYLVWKN